MARSYRVSSFILSLALLIFSCSEEEPQENVTPSIKIISPSSSDLLKKTVVIEAEVVQSGFSHAKIFLGDILIGESAESAIKISYDTKQLEDGIHKLKIVATDKKGNEVEAFVEVEILNYLLTFSGIESFIGWYFITDYNGTLLCAKKCNKNESVSFETPENYAKGQLFILHKFSSATHDDPEVYPIPRISSQIESYMDLKPGKYWNRSYQTETKPMGPYQFKVINVPTSLAIGLNGQYGNYSLSVAGTTCTFNDMTMPTYNTNLFCNVFSITNENIVPKYTNIQNVSAGQSTIVDFQNFTNMNHVDLTFDSQMDRVSTILWSITSDKNNGKKIYNQSLQNTSSKKLYYPGNTFSGGYITDIILRKGNRSHYFTKVGEIPLSHKLINADVSSLVQENGNVTINSTGTFDYQFIGGYKNWTTGGKEYSLNWTIYMNEENKRQLKLVALPAEILNEYPFLSGVVVDFKEVYLGDYDGFTGYRDYIRYSFQSTEPAYSSGFTTITDLSVIF